MTQAGFQSILIVMICDTKFQPCHNSYQQHVQKNKVGYAAIVALLT